MKIRNGSETGTRNSEIRSGSHHRRVSDSRLPIPDGRFKIQFFSGCRSSATTRPVFCPRGSEPVNSGKSKLKWIGNRHSVLGNPIRSAPPAGLRFPASDSRQPIFNSLFFRPPPARQAAPQARGVYGPHPLLHRLAGFTAPTRCSTGLRVLRPPPACRVGEDVWVATHGGPHHNPS